MEQVDHASANFTQIPLQIHIGSPLEGSQRSERVSEERTWERKKWRERNGEMVGCRCRKTSENTHTASTESTNTSVVCPSCANENLPG